MIDILAPSLAVGGAVFFSVLTSGVHIPPHHDATNARITCHLGVLVPDKCAIKVDGDTQEWNEGGCLFFDASFMHEAWNKSDSNRVCLILDLWHPELTQLERLILAELQRIVASSTPGWKEPA
jgi:aspartyl/asparaginyl beta-hydroxylase (cupin superfamily)